jgi:tripartite-type tricarboxylate transporter receptor subunit TctC
LVTSVKIRRRKFLHLAMGAMTLSAGLRTAGAQTYPSRPVRILVGYAAGGSADTLARLMAQWLSERLGQPFVVENRSGANGNIAADALVRAPSDGHTLLMLTTPNLITPPLPTSFDFSRDTAAIGGVSRGYLVMLVHPSVPATTVPEFIAYAKANPGKLAMASAGSGTAPHLSGELFKMMTGIDMIHVPYRGGGPAIADLLGGQVQVTFSNLPVAEHVRAGTLRALAVTTAARSQTLPQLPTIGDFVPGYEASVAFGLCAPKQTPAEIIEKLNSEINAGLADPAIATRLREMGSVALSLSPTDFRNFLSDESLKWARVVRAANIKPD